MITIEGQNILNNIKDIDIDKYFNEYNCNRLFHYIELKGYVTATGATKFVVIGDSTVLKIPFNTYIDFIRKDKEDIYSIPDYCEIETSIYNQAKEYGGIDQFFAREEKVGEIAGMPIYEQEKCITYRDDERDRDEEYLETIEKISKECDVKNIFFGCLRWTAELVYYYGWKAVNRLIDYCKEYGYINDLHDGNYGYRADGTPCFIDYSGYDIYEKEYLETIYH